MSGVGEWEYQGTVFWQGTTAMIGKFVKIVSPFGIFDGARVGNREDCCVPQGLQTPQLLVHWGGGGTGFWPGGGIQLVS